MHAAIGSCCTVCACGRVLGAVVEICNCRLLQYKAHAYCESYGLCVLISRTGIGRLGPAHLVAISSRPRFVHNYYYYYYYYYYYHYYHYYHQYYYILLPLLLLLLLLLHGYSGLGCEGLGFGSPEGHLLQVVAQEGQV